MAVALALSGSARPLAAAIVFIDGCPGSPLCLFLRYSPILIAFSDVIGLAFLLVRVFGFIATRHGISSSV